MTKAIWSRYQKREKNNKKYETWLQDCTTSLRVHIQKSTFRNIAEQFKIYLNSLPPDKKNEIERDYQANGNGLLSVRDTESTVELFDSFAM